MFNVLVLIFILKIELKNFHFPFISSRSHSANNEFNVCTGSSFIVSIAMVSRSDCPVRSLRSISRPLCTLFRRRRSESTDSSATLLAACLGPLAALAGWLRAHSAHLVHCARTDRRALDARLADSLHRDCSLGLALFVADSQSLGESRWRSDAALYIVLDTLFAVESPLFSRCNFSTERRRETGPTSV